MDTTPIRKIKRPGAGRTKGSFSFVAVSLVELNQRLGGIPDLKLMVSRKQLEAFGFTNLKTDKVADLKESIAGQSTELQIPAAVIEL
jgi:hypothetical protein